MDKSFEKKRILVTGGCGFIGSHLVRALVYKGADVGVLVTGRNSCWRLEDVKGDVRFYKASITHEEKIVSLVNQFRPQYVYHLAALLGHSDNEDGMMDVNFYGTIALLKAAASVGTEVFVHTGTSEEYGRNNIPFEESQREDPVSLYSFTKTLATKAVFFYSKFKDISSLVIRPGIVYGPAQDGRMLIPALIQHCLENKDFAMTSARATRDFIYVDDVIEAYLMAALTPRARGEIINIGSGVESGVADTARLVVSLAVNPIHIDFGAKSERHYEIHRFVLEIKKAKKILGWKPTIDLKEGLKKTILWYEHHRPQWKSVTP